MRTLTTNVLVSSAIALALGFSNVQASDKITLEESLMNARQEAQISTTYALSPYLQTHGLQVSVLDGKAILTGNVSDEIHKELAGAIADGVDGVDSVDNRIVVDRNYQRPSSNDVRDYADVVSDAEINAAIKSKLLWSKHSDGMDMVVVTENGHVELTGNVATQQMKQLAQKLALDTQGVRSVRNELQVSEKTMTGHAYGKDKTADNTMIEDSWITTKVKSSLLYSRNVSGFDIGVKTNKGVVTLDGLVSSGIEKALAIELAEHVRGVNSVEAKGLVF
ncbi:transporter [Pseudidiomarina aestuarii]|uniref:Transporter n=1 Tax=Pseudidiomarina aestuarii TaxID=624146 RepID=A0A7Z6ZT75_9GAMM|nr:BON domain-containing protein [Pseudidiomarina aestuarii]RUO40939.1 transporter [Pseudidiomarina aestuarii]